MRVLPDVAGLEKVFDYRVPASWDLPVEVGTRVRVELNGRRVGGWVVEVDVDPPPGVVLRPLAKHSGAGPPPDVVALGRWVAHRWHGRWAAVLGSASPDRVVAPAAARARIAGSAAAGPARGPSAERDEVEAALDAGGVTVVRLPPSGDRAPYVAAAARRGDALVLHPAVGQARHLSHGLARAGGRAALLPRDWGRAAAGGCSVFGARSAALGPVGRLAAVVVFDEHDEGLQEERNPTWHARDVAIERSRRAGVPCLLVSPCPSLAAMAAAERVVLPSRAEERAGWPVLDVVDRRREDPGRAGLFSPRFAESARRAGGKVVCVLNRTGRARLLACASCGELVRTEDGRHVMVERDGHLEAPVTGERRPLVCAVCTGTSLKRLRLGVDRAREELEALLRQPVAEVTADVTTGEADARVIIGTEAVLHRVGSADLVAFLDFDQELLAPRYRAAEQAYGLLARAAEVVGPRAGGGRVLVQTRNPDHRVLQAALRSDPGRFVAAEQELRHALALPPASALAELSGPGADDLAAQLGGRLGVDLLGPSQGRWLVRAPDADGLAAALAATTRPSSRVRVAVDPPRA